MKTTHTIQDIDALLIEKVILLKTAETKEEREKLHKQIKRLEKHFNDCNGKYEILHKYPERIKSLYDPTPMTAKAKKELLELIDSVEVKKNDVRYPMTGLDLTGVSVGRDRFVYEEKGW